MVERWIVFGGWATEATLLAPLFGPEPIFLDATSFMPRLMTCGTLRPDWQEVAGGIVAELMPESTDSRKIGIAGWSTGAIAAYAAASRIKPGAAVLLSATPSFCRRPGFAYGWKPTILRSMREKLKAEPVDVLEQFHDQCGLAAGSCPSTMKGENTGGLGPESISALEEGLCFLEEATLLPVSPPPCPALFLHGRSDTIVPFQAGKRFCEEAGGVFAGYEGPHAFYRGREEEIAGVIRDFVGMPDLTETSLRHFAPPLSHRRGDSGDVGKV